MRRWRKKIPENFCGSRNFRRRLSKWRRRHRPRRRRRRRRRFRRPTSTARIPPNDAEPRVRETSGDIFRRRRLRRQLVNFSAENFFKYWHEAFNLKKYNYQNIYQSCKSATVTTMILCTTDSERAHCIYIYINQYQYHGIEGEKQMPSRGIKPKTLPSTVASDSSGLVHPASGPW